jgi:membrane dipeptidase
MTIETTTGWKVSEEAGKMHRESLVWDNHACLPQSLDPQWIEGLERYRKSGAKVVMVNIGDASLSLETRIRLCALYRHWIKERSDRFQLIDTVDDVLSAAREGKMTIGFAVEGAVGVDGQLSVIPLYYDLGVRWMLLAYNRSNRYAAGCHDENTGLTDEGYDLIAEMDRVGIVKCCSHTAYRTARDIFEASSLPVIFSHSNPRALKTHGRNVPDDLIRACAATGGVVGINGIGLFLGDNDNTTETFIRHVVYVADLVGSRHVGLGLDYFNSDPAVNSLAPHITQDAEFWPPGNGYEDAVEMKVIEPERLPQITEALLDQNFSDDEVRGILGGNFLRVAQAVWQPRTEVNP